MPNEHILHDFDHAISALRGQVLAMAGQARHNVERAVQTDFRITEAAYTGGEQPSVSLTFNSRTGANYAIFATTSLQQGQWLEMTDNFPSQGEERCRTCGERYGRVDGPHPRWMGRWMDARGYP